LVTAEKAGYEKSPVKVVGADELVEFTGGMNSALRISPTPRADPPQRFGHFGRLVS